MSHEMDDHRNTRLPITIWKNQVFHNSRDTTITLNKKDVPFMFACSLCHWPLDAVEVFRTRSGCCVWRR